MRPSLPLPAGSSSWSRSEGCECGSAACRARPGQLLIPLPLSYISVQLVLTAAPEKRGCPSPSALPCPGNVACNPPPPLGLSGNREASPISASEQSLCMAASARPSTLGVEGFSAEVPNLCGAVVPCSMISE